MVLVCRDMLKISLKKYRSIAHACGLTRSITHVCLWIGTFYHPRPIRSITHALLFQIQHWRGLQNVIHSRNARAHFLTLNIFNALAVCDRGTPSGFPHLRRLPLPINGWPTAMTVFEARHAAQGGTTTTAKTGSSGHQGNRTPNSQGKKASTAGLRPDGRTKRGTCRAWLIDDRSKAWSKRPDRQAGRHGRKRPPLRGAKTGTKRARRVCAPCREGLW